MDSPSNAEWTPEQTWKIGSGGAAEVTWAMQADQGIKHLGGREEEVGSWDLRGGAGSGSMGKRFLVRKGDKRESVTPSCDSGFVAYKDPIISRQLLLRVITIPPMPMPICYVAS